MLNVEGSPMEENGSRLDSGRKPVEPCTIVIFGASGDLTSRKLIPALYHLFAENQMPDEFRVIGFARREKTDESWREELKEALLGFSRSPVDMGKWEIFCEKLFYCRGDLTEEKAYLQLKERLDSFTVESLQKNHLFYLAIAPTQFGEVVRQLHESGVLRPPSEHPFWQRVVVEKPFGQDLTSAHKLNQELLAYLQENQIFRIDHYLGKETVQNILIFRFANVIFEELWNRDSVDHVQITVSENIGVGDRGGYYEEAGALRDMVQNHLLQVMSLVAMEPPASLEAESIRDEKVKLLKSIQIPTHEEVAKQVVRGQYLSGEVGEDTRKSYRRETKVDPHSNVETFVTLKLFVENWRWLGVPFYLRTGKNLPTSASEVRVQFKPTPNVLYAAHSKYKLDQNAITLRLQPDEGIFLRFNGKIPGSSMNLRPVRMHFSYDSEFGAYTPEAYERLLLEAMVGDATLFIRRDEVETAWKIVDSIRAGWKNRPLSDREFYPAGFWGPVAADDLLAESGHAWVNPKSKI